MVKKIINLIDKEGNDESNNEVENEGFVTHENTDAILGEIFYVFSRELGGSGIAEGLAFRYDVLKLTELKSNEKVVEGLDGSLEA